jgi:hypothetical protein
MNIPIRDYVLNETKNKLGACVSQTIDGTERWLNCATLSNGGSDYPIKVELEARNASCYIKQGDSSVALAATNGRLLDGEKVIVDIDSASDAYFAVKQESINDSGTIVAMRLDRIL